MAKLADAADIKSAGPQGLWGFKSPSRHQKNLISFFPPFPQVLSSVPSVFQVFWFWFFQPGGPDSRQFLENWIATRYHAPSDDMNQPLNFVTGHSEEVTSLAFSPDGETLATIDDGNAVWLWDIATRQPLGQPLTGHSDRVNSVVFSPDGKTLASASWDHTVRLWDVATRRPVGEPLTGHHNKEITSVAFSPDGKTLASAGWDHTVRLWDVATRRPLGEPLTGQNVGSTVAFSPDGKALASVSDDKTVRLW